MFDQLKIRLIIEEGIELIIMVGSIIITVTAIKIFLTNAKLAFGSEIVAIAGTW